MTQPTAGWYPDPSGDVTRIRYWDGAKWTEHVRSSTDVPTYTQQSVSYQQTPAAAPVVPGYQGQPIQQGYQPLPNMTQYSGQIGGQTGQLTKDNFKAAQAGLICSLSGMGLSIVSLVLTSFLGGAPILSLLFVFSYVLAIPSIVLGAIGLKSSKRSLAIISLVLGILGIVVFVLLMVTVYFYMVNHGML